ncbi:hypothetical protein MVEN_00896000 [Mycena venus]|uniref:Uncharacterized protein n=1 Tax=Mycena venus TaxID=2733690 RepID=A0A8H6YCB6_9AGAR|nr:hypothetical protein MVEN_00896000 [Mycena venus]
MPPQSTLAETRLNNITTCLTSTLALLEEISDAFGTPFIQPISNTTQSLITAVQNVKRNKDECIELMQNIHQILYSIVNLHLQSETAVLPPSILHHIGNFTK